MFDIRDELESAIECARQSAPIEAIAAAKWSLHYGPSGGGARMSFEEAILALQTWADSVSDITLTESYPVECDEDSDEDSDEWQELEIGRIDSRDIVRGIVGRELVAYL